MIEGIAATVGRTLLLPARDLLVRGHPAVSEGHEVLTLAKVEPAHEPAKHRFGHTTLGEPVVQTFFLSLGLSAVRVTEDLNDLLLRHSEAEFVEMLSGSGAAHREDECDKDASAPPTSCEVDCASRRHSTLHIWRRRNTEPPGIARAAQLFGRSRWPHRGRDSSEF